MWILRRVAIERIRPEAAAQSAPMKTAAIRVFDNLYQAVAESSDQAVPDAIGKAQWLRSLGGDQELLEFSFRCHIDGQTDAAPDGRFVINRVPDTAASPITLIQNWNPAARRSAVGPEGPQTRRSLQGAFSLC